MKFFDTFSTIRSFFLLLEEQNGETIFFSSSIQNQIGSLVITINFPESTVTYPIYKNIT